MQILINGLISGMAIGLLAVAFQTVYLPTRIFFISLAGIYSVSPYIFYTFLKTECSWCVAIFLTILISCLISIIIEWCNHRPLVRKQASSGAHLVSSLGIYIILVQLVAIVWGSDTKSFYASLDSSIHVGLNVITQSQFITMVVSSSFLICYVIFITCSNIGLRLRAMADNPAQFALFGYSITSHRILAFGLSGTIAAVSSLVTAREVGFNPYVGLHALLLAMVAVIIGGYGSFFGPIIGALILGILRALVAWHLSAKWQEAATFILLALFLILRPQGLLGTKKRIEAT